MGYFAFFLLITAASLLWSAACTAAAVRSERSRTRGLWLFLGLALPVLTLLPFLYATAHLAFESFLRPNWFDAVLTVVLSALIGGIWITRAGMRKTPFSSEAVAARWPAVGLFALAILAKAVSFGTLLILDNAVAAEARAMRVEAAAMMQAALPPAPVDAENAARLHLQAGAAIAAAPDLTPGATAEFVRHVGRQMQSLVGKLAEERATQLARGEGGGGGGGHGHAGGRACSWRCWRWAARW
jgi:hypothetical protein